MRFFLTIQILTAALGLTLSSTASASPKGPVSPSVETLWHEWYTITVSTPTGKRVPFGYYSDLAERTQGRIRFQNQMWKKEEGFINEESLGAFAQDDATLTPLFFNFRSAYRDTETVIDGTVQQNRKIGVRSRRGGQENPLIQVTLSQGAIFSSHFPVWLQRRLPTLRADRWEAFTTILEDSLEMRFKAVPGRVRLEKEDATAQRLKARRLTVHYRDQDSTWYVDAKGIPLRIEIPSQNAVVERVTEKQARSFLNDPSSSE